MQDLCLQNDVQKQQAIGLYVSQGLWHLGTLKLALVSAGTHEELLSKPNGAYSQLICLQQIYKQQYKDTGGEAELYTPDNQSHTWRHRNELSSLL
jgi:hypothetical protein